MTPDQREAVAKGLLDVASALQRVAAALADQVVAQPGNGSIERCGYAFPFSGGQSARCVLPADHLDWQQPHVPEGGQ